MRPRRNRRGNARKGAGQRLGARASMRPRRNRRGNLISAILIVPLPTCFNEAAAESPRKCIDTVEKLIQLNCFNEAAAESPRK